MTSVIVRLTARSHSEGECIVFDGHRSTKGYGQISVGNSMQQAHRAAWVELHGPIPPETPCVLHHCDNPPCFRDEHLFLGTVADNNWDRANKGRHHGTRVTHCPKGHPLSGDNLVLQAPNGAKGRLRRGCKTCIRASQRAFRSRARSAAAQRFAAPKGE